MPAQGLYPYQWCWDSGPIALGWAAAGCWEYAWTELERLMSAQWRSGLVPHIVFWENDSDYFPGPGVWATGHDPPTTGITQPPLPVVAAARLARTDPDRHRAAARFRRLEPSLRAWLAWMERARRGPHGAVVIVHPWESGMDNSPSWDEPLSGVPEVTDQHIERRDVRTVSAAQRPSQKEYRQYLGLVERLRAAGWDSERQPLDSAFAVEDPGFTAIAARAAEELAQASGALGLDGSEAARLSRSLRSGLEELWDDDDGWYRPYDVLTGQSVGPATSAGLVGLWADIDRDRAERMVGRIHDWTNGLACGLPTCDPADPAFDPVRYWRGPVWVLVNWLAAGGLDRHGFGDRSAALRATTRALVEGAFSEYYNPGTCEGIGGRAFSWSAALALDWLTD